MNLVILAAGRGSRMHHLTSRRPKCLLPIYGKTALNRLIDTARSSGVVNTIVVVGGYCFDQVKAAVPSFVNALVNERFAESNSIVSLDVALSVLPPGDLVFLNSDIVYEENLLIRFLRHPRKTACLIDELAPYDPAEFHVRMHDARVAEISRLLPRDRVHGRDAQAYRVEGRLVPQMPGLIQDIIRERGPGEYAGQVMLPLISSTQIAPIFTNGEFWGEFDTPEEYADVDRQVTLAERSERTLESYGLSPPSHPESPELIEHERARRRKSASGFAVARLRDCVLERRLPSKLDRPLDIARAIPVRLGTAVRFAWPLLTRRLSRKAYRLQVYGAELLRVFMQEAAELQIKPFLVWGTLLGCVREGTFIFNDEDVDVGLSDADFARVEDLKHRMAIRGYAVRRQDSDKISFLHPRATGLHIDVDRFHVDASCLWIKSENSDDDYVYSNFFPLNTLDKLKPMIFEGVDVCVPADPEAFLQSVYGTWQVPEMKHDIRRGPLNLYLRKKGSIRTGAK